jgi:hypothetical protein
MQQCSHAISFSLTSFSQLPNFPLFPSFPLYPPGRRRQKRIRMGGSIVFSVLYYAHSRFKPGLCRVRTKCFRVLRSEYFVSSYGVLKLFNCSIFLLSRDLNKSRQHWVTFVPGKNVISGAGTLSGNRQYFKRISSILFIHHYYYV